MYVAISTLDNLALVAFAIVAVVLGGILYFFPSFVAYKSDRQPEVVFIVNLFFGWTLIGWAVALAIASSTPRPTIVYQQPLPPPISLDGYYYWDGYAWQPPQTSPTP